VIGGSTSTMLEKLEVVGEANGNNLILDVSPLVFSLYLNTASSDNY